MSYLDVKKVQAWLQASKYKITTVDPELETAAKDYLFGEFAQRYDTSSWTDETNTPSLVLSTMAMLVASYHLRRAVSQDDGLASYADWLEGRVSKVCESIVSGSTVLPGVTPDADSSLGGGPLFYPTDLSTELYTTDPLNEDSSIRSFTMGMEF